MKRQSSRAKEIAKIRASLRGELLIERGYFCEGCPVTPVGTNPPRLWSDLHEKLTRARGGDPTDKSVILCLCRPCHHFITVNPAWAEANGFMRGRTADEHRKAVRPWEN